MNGSSGQPLVKPIPAAMKASRTLPFTTFISSNQPSFGTGTNIPVMMSWVYAENLNPTVQPAALNGAEIRYAKLKDSWSFTRTQNLTEAPGPLFFNDNLKAVCSSWFSCRHAVSDFSRSVSSSVLAARSMAFFKSRNALSARPDALAASPWADIARIWAASTSSVALRSRSLSRSLMTPVSFDPRRAKATSPATPKATAAPGQFQIPTSPIAGSRYSAPTPMMTARPDHRAKLSAIFAAVSIVSSLSLGVAFARKKASLRAWALFGGLAFWSAIAALLSIVATRPA